METKWRIPEGRTLDDTKISERIKELHMSQEKLATITAHLTRNERAEALAEAENEKTRKMKAISENMTKDWSDSIQRQHAARQQELEDMLNKQDDKNLVKFLSVKKEQEAERNMYINEMRYRLLQRKDFPKALGSAYIFSEVLSEREKQKEFSKIIQQQKREIVQEEIDDMRADVKQYEEEQAEIARKLKEKDQFFAQELIKQVAAVKTAKAKERADKVAEELLDQERARAEAAKIEEQRVKKAADARQAIRDSVSSFLDTQAKEKEKQRLEDETTDLMNKYMQKGRDHVQAIMKQKARQRQEERLARGLKTFDNSKTLKREADLKLIYDKGQAKMAAEQQARDLDEQEKCESIRQERIQERRKDVIKRAAEEKHQKELKKWEMMNRFKVSEAERLLSEERQLKICEDKINLREKYQEELRLKAERLKTDKYAELQAILEKNANDDKIYLEYAQEVMQSAEENNWNTVPITRVINKYKQNMMGEKRPTRCEKLRAEMCAKKEHAATKPGRRTHCPASDPTFKCKHQKERVYK